jgi:hypothetical protein
MKIKTASGMRRICKRSHFGKFLQSYIATGAFSGVQTLNAAWGMANQIKRQYNTLSWSEIGKMVGIIFKHKPSDAFLTELTGVQMPR